MSTVYMCVYTYIYIYICICLYIYIYIYIYRHVVGVLRGYDQFMNIVLDNTVEIVSPTEKNEIGTEL